jgi:hypothetical protein
VGSNSTASDPRAILTPGNCGFLTCIAHSRSSNFQIAAPEGFSARRSAPARTTPGVAGMKPGLLVSIIAFQSSIGADYATNQVNGQFYKSNWPSDTNSNHDEKGCHHESKVVFFGRSVLQPANYPIYISAIFFRQRLIRI